VQEVTNIFRDAWAPPLEMGRGRPLETRPPTRVAVPNLADRSDHMGGPAEIRRKNGFITFRLLRLFKVIGTDTDRSATYDFLSSSSSSLFRQFGP